MKKTESGIVIDYKKEQVIIPTDGADKIILTRQCLQEIMDDFDDGDDEADSEAELIEARTALEEQLTNILNDFQIKNEVTIEDIALDFEGVRVELLAE